MGISVEKNVVVRTRLGRGGVTTQCLGAIFWVMGQKRLGNTGVVVWRQTRDWEVAGSSLTDCTAACAPDMCLCHRAVLPGAGERLFRS